MEQHPAPDLPFLAAAGGSGLQQPQQQDGIRGGHAALRPHRRRPAPSAPASAAASSSTAPAAAPAAYCYRLQPLPAMLPCPTRPSPLLRGVKEDAAAHAAVLLAASYDAVQGHQRPPPPEQASGRAGR